jgi:hypothetical protein
VFWISSQNSEVFRFVSLNFYQPQRVKICFTGSEKYIKEPGGRSRYSDWLRAGLQRGRSSSPGRVKNSLLHAVETGSGGHPASYPMGTGSFLSGGKLWGGKSDHASLTSAEAKKTRIHSTIRLHAVALGYLNTGALPYIHVFQHGQNRKNWVITSWLPLSWTAYFVTAIATGENLLLCHYFKVPPSLFVINYFK